jgi:hypothetical protein
MEQLMKTMKEILSRPVTTPRLEPRTSPKTKQECKPLFFLPRFHFYMFSFFRFSCFYSSFHTSHAACDYYWRTEQHNTERQAKIPCFKRDSNHVSSIQAVTTTRPATHCLLHRPPAVAFGGLVSHAMAGSQRTMLFGQSASTGI